MYFFIHAKLFWTKNTTDKINFNQSTWVMQEEECPKSIHKVFFSQYAINLSVLMCFIYLFSLTAIFDIYFFSNNRLLQTEFLA